MALSVGFEKQAIIGECVDSFCLVCNSHLRTYDEVIVHIEKPIHKKNLDSAQFNEKYKEDNILKVREGYFCMFCCILLSTIRKVALHVVEPHHISNEGIQLLKRFGAFITAYDEIFITNAAWGGIMDGSCALCDVEVTDEKRHETETVHVLNVIRSVVEFGEGRQIYRKVDDNSIYCITCNEMFSNEASKSHFNELEHNNKLEACKNAYKMHKHGEENNILIEPLKNSICTVGKEEIQNVDRISSSSSEGFNIFSSDDETVDVSYRRQINGPISSSLDKFKKNGIYIDLIHNIAYCEKCTKNVDFNCKAINKHIEEHGKSYKERNDEYAPYLCEADPSFKSQANPERDENGRPQSAMAYQDTDSDSDKQSTLALSNDINHVYANETVDTDNIASEITDDPIIIAKTNMLTYNKDNSNAYCRICEVNLPANINNMKEHVSGKGHKKNVSNQTDDKTVDVSFRRQTYGPISSSLDKFMKNGIYIDIKYNIAYCEKCTENVDFNCKAINKHIEEHGKSYEERNDEYLPYLCEADTSFTSRDNGRPQSAIASQDTDRQTYGPISSCLDKFKENGIYIDIVYNIAYCEKCTENVDFNCKAINKHIEEHGKSYKERNDEYVPYVCEADTSFTSRDYGIPQSAIASQDTDSDSDKQSTLALSNDINHVYANETVDTDNIVSEIIDNTIIFAKTNMLTYNKDNSNAYCPICEVNLTVNINNMKEHVSGKGHKENVSNLTLFVKTNMLTYNKDNSNAYCRICEVNLPANINNMKEHVSGKGHKENVSNLTLSVKTNMLTYNKDNSNAYCCICEVNLPANINNTKEHVSGKGHKENVSNLTLFVKTNMLTYNKDNSNAYCRICEVNLPANINNMKEHVSGKGHKENVSNLTLFVKTNMLTYNKDNSNAYCRICEVKLPGNINNMIEHVSGKSHKKNVSNQTPIANTDEHGSVSNTDESFIE